ELPVIGFLQVPRVFERDTEKAGDEFAHALVDLTEQVALDGIERVVEIEDPHARVVERAPGWLRAGHSSHLCLAAHQGADAVLGEELEQPAMRYASAEHDHRLDPGFNHFDAALDFGDHATADGAGADQRARLLDR